MRLIPGTRLELVRCTDCAWEQILNGWGCGRCGGKVEELPALPVLAPKSLAGPR